MKIFSNHRRKLDPHRRYGSREFKNKLWAAKNYKRETTKFFAKTGLSQVGVGVAILLLGGLFYFLILSPYFLVQNITVSGNQQVSNDQIRDLIKDTNKKRFLLVPQNSLFMLSSNQVNSLVTKNISLVREAKSKRSWPNKLTIQISERVPTLNLEVNGKYYLIDDLGFVVRELPAAENILTVTDQVDEDVKVGETIDGKLIPFIISMQKSWPSKLTTHITEVRIPGKGATEASFVSAEGWSAMFSTDRPVTNQLSNLVLLLNKQIPASDRDRLAYIDLRLAKWAYYCFKSTPCQQTAQPETAAATTDVIEP